MLTWFIYDISNDKIRNKVSKIAQEYGLYRVQKSVFFGNINKNKLDEIILKSKKIINIDGDSLYIFPMCEKDFKNSILIGPSIDTELITGKKQFLFL